MILTNERRSTNRIFSGCLSSRECALCLQSRERTEFFSFRYLLWLEFTTTLFCSPFSFGFVSMSLHFPRSSNCGAISSCISTKLWISARFMVIIESSNLQILDFFNICCCAICSKNMEGISFPDLARAVVAREFLPYLCNQG